MEERENPSLCERPRPEDGEGLHVSLKARAEEYENSLVSERCRSGRSKSPVLLERPSNGHTGNVHFLAVWSDHDDHSSEDEDSPSITTAQHEPEITACLEEDGHLKKVIVIKEEEQSDRESEDLESKEQSEEEQSSLFEGHRGSEECENMDFSARDYRSLHQDNATSPSSEDQPDICLCQWCGCWTPFGHIRRRDPRGFGKAIAQCAQWSLTDVWAS